MRKEDIYKYFYEYTTKLYNEAAVSAVHGFCDFLINKIDHEYNSPAFRKELGSKVSAILDEVHCNPDSKLEAINPDARYKTSTVYMNPEYKKMIDKYVSGEEVLEKNAPGKSTVSTVYSNYDISTELK